VFTQKKPARLISIHALPRQAVIDANIIPLLIKLMSDANAKTRKEACWSISNATAGGSPDQVR